MTWMTIPNIGSLDPGKYQSFLTNATFKATPKTPKKIDMGSALFATNDGSSNGTRSFFFFKGGSNLQIKSMVLLKDLPWMLCVKFGLVSYNEPCMMLSPQDMENVFPQLFIVLGQIS